MVRDKIFRGARVFFQPLNNKPAAFNDIAVQPIEIFHDDKFNKLFFNGMNEPMIFMTIMQAFSTGRSFFDGTSYWPNSSPYQ